MTRSEKTEGSGQHHALPRWVQWVQDNFFLPCLILAEAYLLGTLMTLGWVGNIEDPQQWGLYHGIGVILFFLAGAMGAGIALNCSVKAAECFSDHRWGFALFNFLGLLVFSTVEIWASLSERSSHLLPTPADQAVLSLLHISGAPVSPTVVIVALLLPFATIYRGFSQRKQGASETEDERIDRERRELAAAKHKAELARVGADIKAANAAGWRKAGLAFVGKDADDQPPQDTSTTGASAEGDEGDHPTQDEPTSSGKNGRSARTHDRDKLREVAAGMWTASDLMRYVADRYGVEMADKDAVDVMRSLPDVERMEGVRGNPYAAPKRTVKQWADRKYRDAGVIQLSAG